MSQSNILIDKYIDWKYVDKLKDQIYKDYFISHHIEENKHKTKLV